MASVKKTTSVEHKPAKTIYQLDSPFTVAPWPVIFSQDQETILELLISLLAPIGQHRANHVNPSKGKRDKKRKRKEEKSAQGLITNPDAQPLLPSINAFLHVGLNTIVRSLEASTKNARSLDNKIVKDPREDTDVEDTTLNAIQPPTQTTNANETQNPHFSAIFVLRSSQHALLHSHLPQLIATASLAHPGLPPTRLVQLPKGCDARLCDALGLPRVSFMGLTEGAPNAEGLLDVIRGCTEPIKIAWLDQVENAKYLPVKINAVQTLVGPQKKKKVPAPKPKK